MQRRKLFLYLSAAAGYLGIGMLLGYMFSDGTKNTALWLGMLLVLCGAILLGMFISARSAEGREVRDTSDVERPPSSSGTITDLPPKQ